MSPCLKSLHHLCAAYDRLGNSSYLVDFRKMDRWYALAEQVVQDSFAPAASDERVRTALCRCLTCYFYQPSPDRDDPWFTYLTATADAWAAAFSPDRGWDGLDEPHILHAAGPLARHPSAPGLRPLRPPHLRPCPHPRRRAETLAGPPHGRKRVAVSHGLNDNLSDCFLARITRIPRIFFILNRWIPLAI